MGVWFHTRGVPQGLVLGPMLFMLYTTEIQEIVKTSKLQSHAYDNDTQLYSYAHMADIERMTPRLVMCIDAIRQWMSSSRLRLNLDKT